jgi:hypothetical protein
MVSGVMSLTLFVAKIQNQSTTSWLVVPTTAKFGSSV